MRITLLLQDVAYRIQHDHVFLRGIKVGLWGVARLLFLVIEGVHEFQTIETACILELVPQYYSSIMY